MDNMNPTRPAAAMPGAPAQHSPPDIQGVDTDQLLIMELVTAIYDRYKLDIDPKDPIFVVMLVLCQALILDDEKRMDNLSERLEFIYVNFESMADKYAGGAVEQFAKLKSDEFAKFTQRMVALLDQSQITIDAMLDRIPTEQTKYIVPTTWFYVFGGLGFSLTGLLAFVVFFG